MARKVIHLFLTYLVAELILVTDEVMCHKMYYVNVNSSDAIRFYGLGAISGGGATSKLLNTYPEKYRSDIYDLLFKPSFGASLQILKVEIGGGAQTTEGTELSHMPRNKYDSLSDLNTNSYQWKVLLEAKKRNPNLILIGLAWSFPGWLSNGTQNPFLYPKLTSKYLIAWLDLASSQNVTIDYLGIWNEPPPGFYDSISSFTKLLRHDLDKSSKYKHIKLIVGDEQGWNITKNLMADKDFYKAVDILGSHFVGEISDPSAKKSGKTLWASADFSTVNNGHGGACLARIINRNFVNGGMTCTIAWNLIASYYDALPFPRSGLMTANQPWSSHYEISPPIWVMAHTTQFTSPGWYYLPVGQGSGNLTYGGTYVSYVNQLKTHLTIVIETMTHAISGCVRPHTPNYNITTQNITLNLTQFTLSTGIKYLHHWESHLMPNSAECNMMSRQDDLKVNDGIVSLYNVPVNTLITLTTVVSGQKGKPKYPIPPSQLFPLNYTDRFEVGNGVVLGDEANYLTPQIGTFQITKFQSRTVLMQTSFIKPVEFCALNKAPAFLPKVSPLAMMLHNSAAYKAGYKITVELGVFKSPDYQPLDNEGVFIALFMSQGGCKISNSPGVFIVFNNTQTCSVYNRFNFTTGNEVVQRPCPFVSDNFYNVTVSVDGSVLSVFMNDKKVLDYVKPRTITGGLMALGCTGFYQCMYDNLSILAND